jgi:RNA polymerase sigma-70 factor, ECF subfamily
MGIPPYSFKNTISDSSSEMHLELTDEELVHNTLKGSKQAFNVLVDRYSSSVYRLACNITRDLSEAEDVVQETYLKAFKHLSSFEPAKAAFKNWLLTIARNQSISVFGSVKRKALHFLSEIDADSGSRNEAYFVCQEDIAEVQYEKKEDLKRLEMALGKLSERQRTALTLKVYEEMSYNEIADIMKLTASSVESLIFRARKRLMELLTDEKQK